MADLGTTGLATPLELTGMGTTILALVHAVVDDEQDQSMVHTMSSPDFTGVALGFMLTNRLASAACAAGVAVTTKPKSNATEKNERRTSARRTRWEGRTVCMETPRSKRTGQPRAARLTIGKGNAMT